MLGTLLIILGLIWLGQKLISSAPQFVKKRAISYRRDEGGEDRISALPEDLLVRILLLVPTKAAVATMILSKRWQFIWTMAPILERLTIKLGPHCPVNANVGKWIGNAVDRRVFVDVSSPVCLPPLKRLLLVFVVYKDDDSVVRLLSSCPILEYLYVLQHEQDNVTKFSVKVPSLETLIYFYRKAKVLDEEDIGRSLAIDSKILKKFFIADDSTNSCSIENKPSFDKAVIYVYSYPDDKFMRSLSSVRYLEIRLSVATVPCCHASNL
ncbi:F-box domain [Arabidopsis suecica]|uniref:F-box domain n=1 Tax=Arabidopsis suecica TaxID=45249 RepID=A0A8T2DM68_ARASU|nr:F-box domain [Arabidopsis suecica]